MIENSDLYSDSRNYHLVNDVLEKLPPSCQMVVFVLRRVRKILLQGDHHQAPIQFLEYSEILGNSGLSETTVGKVLKVLAAHFEDHEFVGVEELERFEIEIVSTVLVGLARRIY